VVNLPTTGGETASATSTPGGQPPSGPDAPSGQAASAPATPTTSTPGVEAAEPPADEAADPLDIEVLGLPKQARKVERVPRAKKAPETAKGIVTRADGRKVRRLQVYLPPALATRLEVYAVMQGKDMSDIVADVLLQALGPGK
jgi:hypothetical protein